VTEDVESYWGLEYHRGVEECKGCRQRAIGPYREQRALEGVEGYRGVYDVHKKRALPKQAPLAHSCRA
jgi:hypothetical protein